MYQGSVDLAQAMKYMERTGMDQAPFSSIFGSCFFVQVGIYGGGLPEMEPLSPRNVQDCFWDFLLVSSRGFFDIK
jgi:hypothetical protein